MNIPSYFRTMPVHNNNIATYGVQDNTHLEQHLEGTLKAQDFQRFDSLLKEPIDYSQLSSRWKKNKEPEDRTIESSNSDTGVLQNQSTWRSDLSQEKSKAAEKLSEMAVFPVCTLTPIYQSLNNGSFASSVTQHVIRKSLDTNQNDKLAFNEEKPPVILSINPLHYPNNDNNQKHSQGSHTVSQSQMSSGLNSLDPKLKFGSELAAAEEAPKTYTKEEIKINRTKIPYHPKLKYFVLASLARQSNPGVLPKQCNGISYRPSFKQNSVTLREEKSGDNLLKFSKIYNNKSRRYQMHQLSSVKFVHLLNDEVYYRKPDSQRQTDTSSNETTSKNQTRTITPSSVVSLLDNHNSELNFERCHSLNKYQSNEVSEALTSQNNASAPAKIFNSINTKSNIDPYACADCGKQYRTSSNLSRHCQLHKIVDDKTIRKCPYCDKTYMSVSAYSMHVKTHRLGCECPFCGKKCSRHWLLQGHIRTHTGEKPFPCPRCGKCFADKSNLRAHIQTHSPDKPFVCGRCQRAFSLKSYLYKHGESSCLKVRQSSR